MSDRIFRGASLVLLTLLVLGALAARPAQVVRAERFELINERGETRALLAADTGSVVLTLLDARGRPASMLRLEAKPWLSLEDGQGRETAGLGWPKVRELTE